MGRQTLKKRNKATIIKPKTPTPSSKSFESSMKPKPSSTDNYKINKSPDIQHTTLLPDGKYRVELNNKQRVLTAEEFKNLNEANKFGGKAANNENVRQAYLDQRKAKEAQKINDPKFKEDILNKVLEEQKRKEILREEYPVNPVYSNMNIPEGEQPGLLDESLNAAVSGATNPLAALKNPKIPEEIAEPIAGVIEGAKRVRGFGTIMKALVYVSNYKDTNNFEDAKLNADQADKAIDEVIAGVKAGSINEAQARAVFSEANENVNRAISDTKKIMETNKVFFMKDGEKQMILLLSMQQSLQYRSVELTNAIQESRIKAVYPENNGQ